MKNLLKLSGIIALAAVIGLSMAGCKNDPDPNLSGNVTISPVGPVAAGTELTANYSGSESVSYQWNKDGKAISGATSKTYKPTAAGSYTVTVSASGYNGKTSAAVTVTGGEDDGFVHNLGSFTFDLVDNYEYGKGYQGTYQKADLFDGEQVTKGDEYTLQITFKASRDLTDLLYVGLVDGTAEANYWTPLSYLSGDENKPDLIEGSAADKIIKQNEKVSATIKMTALESATSEAPGANMLVFMTDCTQGTPGTGGSGTLGKITLTFSGFIFAKGEIDDIPEPPPPPPELPAGITLIDAADITYEEEGKRAVFISWTNPEAPKYLLLSVGEGGDGLAGTTIIFNGDMGWTETSSSPGWTYDGTWAAPAKVFIFDLSLCSKFDEISGYWYLGLWVGDGENTKIVKSRITGAAFVDVDTDGATAIAVLCTSGNKVTDSTVLWYVDADSIEEMFE